MCSTQFSCDTIAIGYHRLMEGALGPIIDLFESHAHSQFDSVRSLNEKIKTVQRLYAAILQNSKQATSVAKDPELVALLGKAKEAGDTLELTRSLEWLLQKLESDLQAHAQCAQATVAQINWLAQARIEHSQAITDIYYTRYIDASCARGGS